MRRVRSEDEAPRSTKEKRRKHKRSKKKRRDRSPVSGDEEAPSRKKHRRRRYPLPLPGLPRPVPGFRAAQRVVDCGFVEIVLTGRVCMVSL